MYVNPSKFFIDENNIQVPIIHICNTKWKLFGSANNLEDFTMNCLNHEVVHIGIGLLESMSTSKKYDNLSDTTDWLPDTAIWDSFYASHWYRTTPYTNKERLKIIKLRIKRYFKNEFKDIERIVNKKLDHKKVIK
jgi:hypothetical protein